MASAPAAGAIVDSRVVKADSVPALTALRQVAAWAVGLSSRFSLRSLNGPLPWVLVALNCGTLTASIAMAVPAMVPVGAAAEGLAAPPDAFLVRRITAPPSPGATLRLMPGRCWTTWASSWASRLPPPSGS